MLTQHTHLYHSPPRGGGASEDVRNAERFQTQKGTDQLTLVTDSGILTAAALYKAQGSPDYSRGIQRRPKDI